MEKPPRVLPWSDVQRLLRAVPRHRPTGLRDFAVLLLLTAYGLGAAEAVTVRLEDIDWRTGVLRLQRPKTGVPMELPLLPAVAHALVAYLRKGRPPECGVREVFVCARLPHRPLSTSAVRHLVRVHARAAGLGLPVGAHTLRHTHATRQIEAGVDPKIVGDILGHRRPSSTSVYARVALERLRAVALPVPR
jgi:integrase